MLFEAQAVKGLDAICIATHARDSPICKYNCTLSFQVQDTQAFPPNVDLDRAHDYYGDSLIEAINRGVHWKRLENGLDGRRFLPVNILTQLKDQFRVTVMGRDCRYRYEISILSFSRLCYANESKWKKVNEIGGKKVRLWTKSILSLWENIFSLVLLFRIIFFPHITNGKDQRTSMDVTKLQRAEWLPTLFEAGEATLTIYFARTTGPTLGLTYGTNVLHRSQRSTINYKQVHVGHYREHDSNTSYTIVQISNSSQHRGSRTTLYINRRRLCSRTSVRPSFYVRQSGEGHS